MRMTPSAMQVRIMRARLGDEQRDGQRFVMLADANAMKNRSRQQPASAKSRGCRSGILTRGIYFAIVLHLQ